MMPTTSTDQPAPQLSAEEIGKRFLRLIKGLGSREELSQQRIQDAMELPIYKASHSENLFGLVGNLDDGWQYALNFYPESPSNKKGIGLRFILGNERFPDMSSVCSLNFAYYHNALKKMGYRDVQITDEIGQLVDFRYYKEDIVISIVPETKYFESEKQILPTCVRSIGTLN